MLEPIALVGFGFLVGLYGTLVGIGGGPLIIPMLALAYDHLPPTTMVATSVAVVFLNSLSGSVAYYQQRRIDLVSGTMFAFATIPASIVAYFLLARVGHHMFDEVFAVFLVCLGGYVLVRPDLPGSLVPAAAAGPGLLGPPSARRIVDAHGHVFVYAVDEGLGCLVNVVLGFVTTMLGIGGGILQVPLLVYTLRMPVHVATATAHYVTSINTGFTLIPLLYYGHADAGLLLSIGCGVVIGARLGARLSLRVAGGTLLKLLTIVFFVTALWMFGH